MEGKSIEISPSSYFSPLKTSSELELIDQTMSFGYLPECEDSDFGGSIFLQQETLESFR